MGQSTSIQKFHDKRLESLNALLCLFRLACLVASGGSIDGIHASICFTAFNTIVARSCPVAFESVYLVQFIKCFHVMRRQSGARWTYFLRLHGVHDSCGRPRMGALLDRRTPPLDCDSMI